MNHRDFIVTYYPPAKFGDGFCFRVLTYIQTHVRSESINALYCRDYVVVSKEKHARMCGCLQLHGDVTLNVSAWHSEQVLSRNCRMTAGSVVAIIGSSL